MKDGTTNIFEPDVLLPTQYWAAYAKKSELPPERLLMLAVLEDAISCFQKHLEEHDPKFREAEEWILEEDGEEPFSFNSICEVLSLNPQYVRRALLGWKEQGRRPALRTFRKGRRPRENGREHRKGS